MPEPHLRAADADRAAVATVLGEHMAAGRLTVDEYDERLAARLRGEDLRRAGRAHRRPAGPPPLALSRSRTADPPTRHARGGRRTERLPLRRPRPGGPG